MQENNFYKFPKEIQEEFLHQIRGDEIIYYAVELDKSHLERYIPHCLKNVSWKGGYVIATHHNKIKFILEDNNHIQYNSWDNQFGGVPIAFIITINDEVISFNKNIVFNLIDLMFGVHPYYRLELPDDSHINFPVEADLKNTTNFMEILNCVQGGVIKMQYSDDNPHLGALCKAISRNYPYTLIVSDKTYPLSSTSEIELYNELSDLFEKHHWPYEP